MSKLFAVSLLSDEDFYDLQKPSSNNSPFIRPPGAFFPEESKQEPSVQDVRRVIQSPEVQQRLESFSATPNDGMLIDTEENDATPENPFDLESANQAPQEPRAYSSYL